MAEIVKHTKAVSVTPESVLLGRDGVEPARDWGPADAESQSPLRAYWEILHKRRGQILTVVLVVLTTIAIYSFKSKPVYRATARMEIEADTPQIQSIKDLYQNIPTDESFLKTKVKVLQSDTLAWETIQQLGLANNPEFGLPPGQLEGHSPESREVQGLLLRRFRNALSVELDLNTHMVEVSFESIDPDLASRVANALVNDYIEYNFRTKYDATRQASRFMEQQLDELKAKVEKSQQALVSYERQNSIVNVSDKQNVAEERLADLSKGLTAAENDRAQKESVYQMVQSKPQQVALLAQNDLLQKLQEKYADIKAQYVDALGQFGPNFPKVTRLRDQVNEVQSLINQERDHTLQRIRDDYQAAVARTQLLASSLAEQKVEVGKLNQLLIQHNILKHEFETNQQLYDSLLQRLKDATVSAGLRATNVHIVDAAIPPLYPVRPRKTLNLVVGFMVGLLLGVALAFTTESLGHRFIRTPEDVERLTHLPSLALIPSVFSSTARSRYPHLKGKGKEEKEAESLERRRIPLAVWKDSRSSVAESYRVLRSSILFSTASAPPQTLLVTSSQPREGKTSTSANLALALAKNGSRVVIVDGDLRAPAIGRAFGVNGGRGLSGVLSGAYSVDEAIQRSDSMTDFWILPAGPHPPNPAELLSSSNMEKLIEELRRRFDFVVIDSPPLLLVTDATILSTLADGVVLVVESGVTSPDALARSHRVLRSAGARVLGAVVNKVNFKRDGYYYSSYSKYYDSYYGYGSSATERVSFDGDSSELRGEDGN